MAISKITSKGQVTIPKSVRDQLRWKSGDRLEFLVDDRGTVTLELASGDLRQLRGLLHRQGQAPVSSKAMDEAVSRHLASKSAVIRSEGQTP